MYTFQIILNCLHGAVVRVALGRDQMIPVLRILILLWDVGAGPSDKTIFKVRSHVAVGVALKKNPPC
jgi:hypothetical protein